MAEAPREVLLRFGEPVAIDRRSVEVYDAFGFRIDTGGPVYPGDDLSLVRIGLRAPLAEQSYLVVWRVVSADGHPAEGSYTFGYRVPARPAVSPTDLPTRARVAARPRAVGRARGHDGSPAGPSSWPSSGAPAGSGAGCGGCSPAPGS